MISFSLITNAASWCRSAMLDVEAVSSHRTPKAASSRRTPKDVIATVLLVGAILWVKTTVQAKDFDVEVFGSTISIEVPHAGPQGSLISATPPSSPAFLPPVIFSAPLPAGSGARALGLAGAFTAVADDATAASWNPAGLMQLQWPEASILVRCSHEKQSHYSSDPSLSVGEDQFSNLTLNYLSLVYPFELTGRRFVFSMNYQEAYDFKQKFSANFDQKSSSEQTSDESHGYTETTTQHIIDGRLELDFVTSATTYQHSAISQIINSELLTDIDFEQEGIIDAITPAIAMRIRPGLYAGLSVNFYQDGTLGTGIRSTTRASYTGTASSIANITDSRTTCSGYSYTGTYQPPTVIPGHPPPPIPLSGSGALAPFTDTDQTRRNDLLVVDGEYTESNRFNDLFGVNATIGILAVLSEMFTVGFTVDTPWTASARQTKYTANTMTTYNSDRTRILETISEESTETRDVEFTFPLYCAAGMVLRWNNRCYTSIDTSWTRWSKFAFKADGSEKVNPLDGSPFGENRIDDTWRVALGFEYFLVFRNSELPLRAGISWEERPAISKPDEFINVSLGSGYSFGEGDNRIILDVAYQVSFGDDVHGARTPGHAGMSSDITEHQLFVSVIKHF